jgi:hypothetical protein
MRITIFLLTEIALNSSVTVEDKAEYKIAIMEETHEIISRNARIQ